MKKSFGHLPSGEEAFLYTISCGGITACVTDLGACLVNLYVPDADGLRADVVLGYDDAMGYVGGDCFLGAIVGRNANRIRGAEFRLGEKTYRLAANEKGNSLHSGPDFYHTRLWQVIAESETAVTFRLDSPDGDQGYPGNASIDVTYHLDSQGGLHVVFDSRCDQDTIFNLTNHSYFNLAGHDHGEAAMEQLLMLPAERYAYADDTNIPTGELRSVAGTPMDFRTPKAIGRDIGRDYDSLRLQGGYDHNYEVRCNPCAMLADPVSGRCMAVSTDLPGVHFYAGNYLSASGKGGVAYGKRSGVALETQFYPDAIHHPEWVQPVTKAGETFHSETVFRFSW